MFEVASTPERIAFTPFSMPPSAASSSLRQTGFAFKNFRFQTAKVGAERHAATRGQGQARLARAQAQQLGLGRRRGVKT